MVLHWGGMMSFVQAIKAVVFAVLLLRDPEQWASQQALAAGPSAGWSCISHSITPTNSTQLLLEDPAWSMRRCFYLPRPWADAVAATPPSRPCRSLACDTCVSDPTAPQSSSDGTCMLDDSSHAQRLRMLGPTTAARFATAWTCISPANLPIDMALQQLQDPTSLTCYMLPETMAAVWAARQPSSPCRSLVCDTCSDTRQSTCALDYSSDAQRLSLLRPAIVANMTGCANSTAGCVQEQLFVLRGLGLLLAVLVGEVLSLTLLNLYLVCKGPITKAVIKQLNEHKIAKEELLERMQGRKPVMKARKARIDLKKDLLTHIQRDLLAIKRSGGAMTYEDMARLTSLIPHIIAA
ncbi:hypothetical protein COO60DRAFT_22031 [Scenedesmus sp. NREL 46B-D3]|nr:hypothetical protein COO60DRAFT_22031 [Scenedesmus sp. NREL 46B-D3]